MTAEMYDPRHPHEPAIPPALDAEGRCLVCSLLVEVERLRAILDRPDPRDFVTATEIEARFQLDRWGDENGQPVAFDGTADADFYRLICHLASKAMLTTPEEGSEKRLHRITTVAAAACNWHMREAARSPAPSEDRS